jgi:uncharacterized Tic20 family protein
MDNQVLFTTIVVVCSLAGWYIVFHKYLVLKAMLKKRDQQEYSVAPNNLAQPAAAPAPRPQEFSQPALFNPTSFMEDNDFAYDEHIPGLGPPPLSKMGFHIPPEALAHMKQNMSTSNNNNSNMSSNMNNNNIRDSKVENKTQPEQTMAKEIHKRLVCNWTCILHLSGFALLTGIPFLNIVVPTVLWLLQKEEHPFLAKQGREIINFQITLSLILFLCLGMGVTFVWLFPSAATSLFAWTKTVRIIFSTGLNMPFNLFTALPFFWACVLMVRGSVAAYHGLAFQYPYAQQFLFEQPATLNKTHSEPAIKRKEPQLTPETKLKPPGGKISFG